MLLPLILALGACSASRPPVPDPDPAPVAPGDCQKAHTRLVELDCPEQSTPQGATFAEACETAAKDGRNWRPDCIAKIESCEDLEEAYSTPEEDPCPQ